MIEGSFADTYVENVHWGMSDWVTRAQIWEVRIPICVGGFLRGERQPKYRQTISKYYVFIIRIRSEQYQSS